MAVVVQFYRCFNFYFPLLLCVVLHDNEYKTKENNKQHSHIQMDPGLIHGAKSLNFSFVSP